jgi:hypothetical protein
MLRFFFSLKRSTTSVESHQIGGKCTANEAGNRRCTTITTIIAPFIQLRISLHDANAVELNRE